MTTVAKPLHALESVSNDGAETIGFSEPYTVRVVIESTAPLLFHRWSVEAVEEYVPPPDFQEVLVNAGLLALARKSA